MICSKTNDPKNDDILIDIGANIGTASIPFALRYDNEVIAFEASKINVLGRNTQGVRLIKLAKTDKLIAVESVDHAVDSDGSV